MKTVFGNASLQATAAILLLAGANVGPARAQVDWTAWTSDTSTSAQGTIAVSGVGIKVYYAGEVDLGATQLNGGFDHWNPTSSYTSASIPNAPTNGNMIAIIGGNATVDSVSFSTPVVNPEIALFSIGAPGDLVTYNFSAPATVSAGGSNSEFGGSSVFIAPGNASVVLGAEGNGVVTFFGTFSKLSWTVPLAENYGGFTVGISGLAPASAAPEPGGLTFLVLLPFPLVSGWLAGLFRRRDRTIRQGKLSKTVCSRSEEPLWLRL